MIPPIVLEIRKRIRSNFYGISGDYKTWRDANVQLAKKNSGDYSNPAILTQVLKSVQVVRNGNAIFERDGVLFYEPDYNYPLLASLMRAMSWYKNKNMTCNILDYGGSLGSTYFQNRTYLKEMNPFVWHIVEQPNFVRVGQENIPEIQFHETLEAFQEVGNSCDILLLSGVLQYFDEPYKWLTRMLDRKFHYIIIDRTFFNFDERDRLGIQSVPPEIYSGTYPAWLLNKVKLIRQIEDAGYVKLDDWESFDRMRIKTGGRIDEKLSEGVMFKFNY